MKKEYRYGIDIGSYYLVASKTRYQDPNISLQVLSNSLDKRLTRYISMILLLHRTIISFSKGKVNPVGKTIVYNRK